MASKKSHDGERGNFQTNSRGFVQRIVPTWVVAHGDIRPKTLENPPLSIFVRRPQFAISPPEKSKHPVQMANTILNTQIAFFSFPRVRRGLHPSKGADSSPKSGPSSIKERSL